MKIKSETAYLGGGCFWCLEGVFSHVKGVDSVTSGYAGGTMPDPTYEDVSTGKTGHAEVIKVDFGPNKISYEEILKIFFSIHDPTTLNRQGNDIGPQYRSIILYTNETQKNSAEKIKNEIEKKKIFANPIVTEIIPLKAFYKAEEYHQKYFEKNPHKSYCQIVIAPKIAHFREKFRRHYVK